jgi:hypothetical protein
VPEHFLVRTKGGPNPGTRVAEGWAWPLPELLLANGGQYIKVSESQLQAMPDDSHLLRGAEYRWQAGDATAEQLIKAISVAIRTKRFTEVEPLLKLLALRDPAQAQAIYDVIQALRP